MRDRLLNYLFGQIDDQERSAIEDALARDPALRAELARLRECTQSPAAPSQLEPPSGLAERTCRYVSEAGGDEREPSGRYRIASDTWEQCTWSGTTKWSLVDLTLAAGVVLAAAVLLLPAIQESRHVARRLQCESNLAELGQALLAYMNCNHNQLPSVLDRGELTVGGSVPMQLAEAGLLDRRRAPQLVTCPGSRLWQQVRTQRVIVLIPTREQFQDKRLVIVGALKTTMGGSLAFRAGYVQYNSYRPCPARPVRCLRMIQCCSILGVTIRRIVTKCKFGRSGRGSEGAFRPDLAPDLVL